MRRVLYLFLISAFFYIGLTSIQKELPPSQLMEMMVMGDLAQHEDKADTSSSFSTHELDTEKSYLTDHHKSYCIHRNICQYTSAYSSPSRVYKSNTFYKVIRIFITHLTQNIQKECDNSASSINSSKYSSGYYLYSLLKIII